MVKKRIPFWGLLIILGGLSIYFIIFEISFKRQEQPFQNISRWGWVALGQKSDSCNGRDENIAIDPQGKIWVAGACTYDGISVFDGEQWQTYFQGRSYKEIAIDSLGQVGVIYEDSKVLPVYYDEKWVIYKLADLPITNAESLGRKWSFQNIGTAKIETDDKEYLWVQVGARDNISIKKEAHFLQGETWVKCFEEGSTTVGTITSRTDPKCQKTDHTVTWENLDVDTQEIISRTSLTLRIREATPGYVWFLPSILGIILLASYLELLPGVLWALGIGVTITLLSGKSPYLKGNMGSNILNPGVFTTYCGVFGALIGGEIDKRGRIKGNEPPITNLLLIIGLVIGFVIGFGWYIINLVVS